MGKDQALRKGMRRRWFHPSRLQWKFALPYILITFAVLGVLNFYPVRVTQNLAFQSKQSTLSGQVSVLASSLSGLETLTVDGIRQVLNLLDEKNVNRSLVTDATGKILYDSTGREEDGVQYALFREIASALSGHDIFYSQYRDGTFISGLPRPLWCGEKSLAPYISTKRIRKRVGCFWISKQTCATSPLSSVSWLS